jgi:capsular exopolysaccharide synthesis family protein
LLESQKIRVWLNNTTISDHPLQTVMVVTCYSGTGSTTTASLLAASLAEGKKSRVLIIDGNFRTPSLNLVFEVQNNGGFSETVSEELPFDAYIQSTNRENLFVLTHGPVSLAPMEVFEGDAINTLLTALKQRFDFIIFDAAPLLEFPDAYALAPRVDGVILVIGAERTSVDDALKAKQDIERAGGRILGVVLNRYKDYRPSLFKKFFKAS